MFFFPAHLNQLISIYLWEEETEQSTAEIWTFINYFNFYCTKGQEHDDKVQTVSKTETENAGLYR